MNRIEKLRQEACAVFDWMPIEQQAARSAMKSIEAYVCRGSLDIHHRTGAGMALKSDDEKTFPLCHRHHMDFHELRGIFKGWSKERQHAWQDEMIARYDRIRCDPEAF